ncbi:MAG: S-adenosylmethionine:tRNA ribosyltransferase-isomerase, partial [Flavobacteriia bacterium]|nr:S-adenosylmethionine:tRNA ribosyltransferase-isomerase [Flavobacteriia bacterium]
AAKLLVYAQGAAPKHLQVRDIAAALEALEFSSGGHLVLNETRVVQARLYFPRGEGQPFELFYLSPASGSVEEAMAATGELVARCKVRFSKKWKADRVLELNGLQAERLSVEGDVSIVRFSWSTGATWSEILEERGNLPLPPYMQRAAEAADAERYQTVFARAEGSVAAPTAGLHWTSERLDEVVDLGWDLQRVKLHVGAGTFQPVSSDQMGEHPMHAEEIHVSLETVEALQDGRPIWVVGTTAARTLESVYLLGRMARAGWELPSLLPQWAAYDAELPACSRAEALEALGQYLRSRGMKGYQGQTQILIAPPYRFQMVDLLMTNFHQPQSTLLLLVAAGIGPVWKDLYAEALQKDYRFLSYGDACLFRIR